MGVLAIRACAVSVVVAGLLLVTAGCGGSGSKSPGVASLGPTTDSSAQTTPSAAAPGGKPSAADFVRFVDCMQKHGIQAQLGEGGRGVSISGADPNSPRFQKAQQTWLKLLPGGGPKPLTPAGQAQETTELLTLAKCMRTHGYPSFPDPDSQGAFDFTGSSVDPNSPQFEAAMNTCHPGNSKVPLRIGIRVRAPSSQNGTSQG